MNSAAAPRVFLVGAGPGDPGLLTVRAVECLRQADLVIYDKLVPVRLLDFANPKAERCCVTEFPFVHAQRWPLVVRAVIDAARQGKIVVRLKGGDPLVFGRGAEEAEELRAAGIPYEIVAGVTAALAAGATRGNLANPSLGRQRRSVRDRPRKPDKTDSEPRLAGPGPISWHARYLHGNGPVGLDCQGAHRAR